MSDPQSRHLRCDALLTRSGWRASMWVTVDVKGLITAVSGTPPEDAGATEHLRGFVMPGFQNAHSHAFQYAMVGLAEHTAVGAAATDDFWTWRDAMYRLAGRLTPDQVEAIAARAYAEMLRFGTTSVVEFHYLHNDVTGARYAHEAEMGERLIAAATQAGIHLTLVPVLYRQGGFGRAPTPGQRRFLSTSLDAYAALLAATRTAAAALPDVVVGLGVHSLRAAAAEETLALLSAPFTGPAHLHVAEQRLEVADCVAHLGRRPVQWLLERLPLDRRFNLVHATHVDAAELRGLARSDATVVLCPSTEGNLGDGFFPLSDYLALGGRCAVGSDSQVSLNPLEELRWLDYGQRLRSEKRNVLGVAAGEDNGTSAFAWAWERGRLAAGLDAAEYFALGQPFDGIVLDPAHPVLFARPPERRLAALLYAGDPSCFLGVMRRGRLLVEGGRHAHAPAINAAFARAMTAVMA